jgi:DNA-binding MarR family transcriptional regulator
VNVAVPTGEAELDEVELAAWRGLLRVHAALVKELDAELEARHGLPLTSYEVLRSLRKNPDGKLRMAELAEHALLSRSGMTRLIDRLEREGMVGRSTCDKDGRGCYAVLTQQGQAAVDQARSTYIAVVRTRFVRHFSIEEMQDLAGLLARPL